MNLACRTAHPAASHLDSNANIEPRSKRRTAALVRGLPSDVLLICEALSGGRRAMRTLVGRLVPVLRARVVRRLGAGHTEVEDVVQEVWLSLLADNERCLRSYDPTRGTTLEGYVGRVAERRAISWLRRQTAQRRGGEMRSVGCEPLDRAVSGINDPAEMLAAQQLAGALGAHLVASLPSVGREILRLVYTDGCPPTSAARELSVSLQVVYNWQHRIRVLSRAWMAAGRNAA